MDFALTIIYGLLPFLGHVADPAYDMFLTDAERRRFSCERMSQERAHELYPGRVPEPGPRSVVFAQGAALVCQPRVVAIDLREPRDEAILGTFSARIGAIVDAAEGYASRVIPSSAPSASPAASNVNWTVDAFYPEPRMAAKIAAAARTRLAERGLRVENRVPMLAAGDLLVLRSLPADRAFPLACRRLADEGSLGPNDAFLAVVLVDPRETELHAGVCIAGNWRWLS